MLVQRPLKLGEVLAETVRLYGDRFWSGLGIGVPVAAAFAVTLRAGDVIDVIVLSVAFTVAFAAAARVAAGDGVVEAFAQAAVRLPTLFVLMLVVSVPFVLAVGQLYLLVPAVAWLGVTAFAIPVAMLERDPDADDWFGRLVYALSRSFILGRTEYLHAVGIAAGLVITYALLYGVLVAALVGFGENGRDVAGIIATVVLAPFFFLGLSVLYFEQKARALSSRSEHPQTREDADAEVPDALDAERAGPADAPREPRARP